MLRALTPPAAHQIKHWLAHAWSTLAFAVLATGVLQVGAHAAARADFISAHPEPARVVELTPTMRTVQVLTWEGADVDGDGAPDFANPTGKAPRVHDAYGYGAFGASRDGGSRRHEGVDYMAEAGQDVTAPLSGYVTKIGAAYAGDNDLKFVEITNRAIDYTARVFYVDPTVGVGDVVRLGQVIGAAHSLQHKYPGGMTNHVHLEVFGTNQKRLDATALLTQEYVTRIVG
ncbi:MULTISPECIES: M23 family metallopeptidase [Phenylobacterium]|uniref:Murein DD-endopeptidase MepM/ murein hydrolase activator NlpD n=1 Tax=Phenylobacterium koreense TaxID=266125 RepID=A0ABV2EEA4_9CAUL